MAGVLVEGVAPTAGTAWDGNNSSAVGDLSHQASFQSLSTRYSGFDDVLSGVESYRWVVGTTPGGVDVQEFRLVPPLANMQEARNTSAVHAVATEIGSLPLEDGDRYYVSVMQADRAG
jgi:hypothetical protein